MQTQQLATIGTLRLFELTKSERGEFVTQLIERMDNGLADPLETHLQIKNMEDIIKQTTGNETYKKYVLDAAEKEGRSFMHHNAKFEIKEVGTKYDFTNCNDPEYAEMCEMMESLKERMKAKETFLKTISGKGLEILVGDELVTVYPPVKTSTTSVAVTLK
jgi:hypothetical protein